MNPCILNIKQTKKDYRGRNRIRILYTNVQFAQIDKIRQKTLAKNGMW